jgi:hypothetical protein
MLSFVLTKGHGIKVAWIIGVQEQQQRSNLNF